MGTNNRPAGAGSRRRPPVHRLRSLTTGRPRTRPGQWTPGGWSVGASTKGQLGLGSTSYRAHAAAAPSAGRRIHCRERRVRAHMRCPVRSVVVLGLQLLGTTRRRHDDQPARADAHRHCDGLDGGIGRDGPHVRHPCGRSTVVWGCNGSGQLGDGTTTNRLAPKRVGSATDWSAVAGGTAHTCGLRAAGSCGAGARTHPARSATARRRTASCRPASGPATTGTRSRPTTARSPVAPAPARSGVGAPTTRASSATVR